MVGRPRIGELLVNLGLLTPEKLEEALTHQRTQGGPGRRLGHVLVELGFVNEVQLTKVLSQHLSVPWVSLHHIDFSRQLLNLVPHELAEEFCLIPIYVREERKIGDTLYLAMEDPSHDEAIRRVTEAAKMPVKSMIAAPSDIRGAIRAFYGASLLAPTPSAVAAPPVPPPPPAAATRPRPAPPLTPVSPPAIPSPVAATLTAPTPAMPPPGPSLPVPPAPREDTGRHAAVQGERPSAPGGIGARVRRTPSVPEKRPGPRMISLTLLDGTSIQIPAQRRRSGSMPAVEAPQEPSTEDRLTTRDLIAALRAVAGGANAEETLGDARWETLLAALLAILLKKQLVADWEFVEEWQKNS